MTTPIEQPTEGRSSFATWRNRIIGVLVLALVLWLAYLVLAAFIPRWWAQRIAEMVHSSFSKGIWYGLVFGLVCTAVPLFLILFSTMVWRKRGGRFVAGALVVLAIAVAVPNLMTLTIVLGNSSAAHAGERILDVDAPGFRGACLAGAIAAAILFALTAFLLARRGFRRHRAVKQRAAQEKAQLTADAPDPAPAPSEPREH
ncbi:permease [Nocardia otitidiscaviarum]|uniref:Permease n=1 Tax=Nocardia otitidiscaviarum TaxID=1823 RepID=A0A516NIY8_9NOCA|nr:permease [Nocardia otitidiscaviarum]MBF6239652.1 permease [Nocardia otitidiscaviarum]MCP9619727.1 permease [Nocardia otitidiscaviarum]QDP78839.1 permease [Nocardia otitidiscaviarum]